MTLFQINILLEFNNNIIMTVEKSILLVHPPVAKASEPPPGIARLTAWLDARGVCCEVFDANLAGLHHLLQTPIRAADTWSRRAAKHVGENIAALQTPWVYAHPDRYKRAVMDVNRVLAMAGKAGGISLSLSDYRESARSPLRSSDLRSAAGNYRDNIFYPFFAAALSARLSERVPAVVGFSVNFLSQALCAAAMAAFIKDQFPGIRVVFGGGLISSWTAFAGFENPLAGTVDDMVGGPGESVLAAMCGAGRDAGNAPTEYDFSGFALERYLSPGPVLPYSTSTGCYWKKCAFCPEKAENRVYRQYNPKAVSAALRRLGKRHAPVLLHFTDNALSPKFLKHLITHPPGVGWYGFVRITSHLADPEFVDGLRAAGCQMLKLGVESGDQKVLDALDKGVDLATVSAALTTLKSAGIATYVYLLFGTPAENGASAEKTRDFTLAHADWIDFLNIAVFNLPAGSREAGCLNTSAFYDGDLSLYRAFEHPRGWNRDRVRRFLERDFKALPALRRVIQNDPPFFTSNHAPLLKVFG